MIRVVIADDIKILRQGLSAILSQDPGIQVVGLASDGKEAYELCRKEKPDVVLMDMRMPGYDGSWGTGKIKEEFPDVRVLVLTTFDDEETVAAAVGSGADGYILKEMEDEKVIQSVKAVFMGVRVFGDSVFEGLKKQMGTSSGAQKGHPEEISRKIAAITGRERDIMRLVAKGMDNKEIASELFLAEGTVRNHISRILEKLELKDRTQLAVFTVKNGLDGN